MRARTSERERTVHARARTHTHLPLRLPARSSRTCSSGDCNPPVFVFACLRSAHWGGREERVKTLSLQEPGSGQIQCTSWRNVSRDLETALARSKRALLVLAKEPYLYWQKSPTCTGKRALRVLAKEPYLYWHT